MTDLSSYWNQSPSTPITPQNTNYYQYAGFLVRFLALQVDVILFLGLLLAVGLGSQLIFPELVKSLTAEKGEILLSSGILGYFIIFTALFGATPGKRLFKLEVLRGNLTKLSLPRVLLRELVGRIIANTIMISYFAIVFNSKKKGLHDFIADTVVVRKAQPWKHETLLIILLFIGIIIIPILSVGFLAAFDPLGQMRKAQEIQKLHNITPEPSGVSYGHFPTVYPSVTMITPTIIPTYFPTPIIGPTDSWSSFVNTAYHYSIKYPPGYVYTSADTSSYPSASTSPNVQIAAGDPNTSPWKIEIDTGGTKQSNISLIDTVSEEIKNRSAFYRPEVPKLAILFTASIAGHNAVFYGNNNIDPDNLVMGAVIEKDATNIVSMMTFPDPKADRNGYTKFLYQIVSTFRFTN